MNKRIISSVLIVALLNLFGCYSADILTIPQYKEFEKKDIKPNEIKVTTKNFKEYQFSNFYIENDTLYGKGKLLSAAKQEQIIIKIALSDIDVVEFESLDIVKTCLWSGGIFLGVIAVMEIVAMIIYASNPP